MSRAPSTSPQRSPRRSDTPVPDHLEKLMENNRQWAAERLAIDPNYFARLCAQQSPEYLWIGCADSRVPANVIMGLASGELFTQRNVGNQATHTDMNVMSCLEYAVTELKVKVIIVCGHYGCGAVKAALSLPSKTTGLVNCWISDIRECRNQHHNELKALGSQEEQVDRLCELNVMRQTFHVCTSPMVQNAWDRGQELSVYGVIYSLKDGLVHKLVGPLTQDNACLDIMEYEEHLDELGAIGVSSKSLGNNLDRLASMGIQEAVAAKAISAVADVVGSIGTGHPAEQRPLGNSAFAGRAAPLDVAAALSAIAVECTKHGAESSCSRCASNGLSTSPPASGTESRRASEPSSTAGGARVDENTLAMAERVAQHIGWGQQEQTDHVTSSGTSPRSASCALEQ
ncbi:hypothetical protein FOA52_014966 [Chlamydomonas sp. UWO 241]|nr:hypothetical protein FOA52_014966 [Chlamydomonas sp. UWO 241]